MVPRMSSLEPAASVIFAAGMLDGSVALVTGGGSGLGRAAASELARCGARVMLAGRRGGAGGGAEEAVAAAAASMGVDRAAFVAGDVRTDAERIVKACVERFGRLDVLVNNAGG